MALASNIAHLRRTAESVEVVALLAVNGLTKTFHGFTSVSDGSFAVAKGGDLGPHRPQRIGR